MLLGSRPSQMKLKICLQGYLVMRTTLQHPQQADTELEGRLELEEHVLWFQSTSYTLARLTHTHTSPHQHRPAVRVYRLGKRIGNREGREVVLAKCLARPDPPR